jgi:hypothetical protein
MSFSYPSGTWTPHTTAEHATDLLNNINTVLSTNNVRVGGVLVQFSANIANVVWILCLAVGAMRALYDQVLFAASQMFSITECSDAQVMAVLPLSGTSLIPGAFSQVTITVTADSGGPAVIPTSAVLPFGTICNFLVVAGATVPQSGSLDFLCIASVIGPIAVGAGSLTAFSVTIAHVASVTNAAGAVQGRYTETVPEVRQRLILGNIADIGIDGTVRALKSLPGITEAELFFNFDTLNNLLVPGGTVIPPRYAYVVVQGQDLSGTAIAAAYARRMTAPTLGTYSQTFVTQSGQNFPVWYDLATPQAVYVNVYYDANSVTASGFDTAIKNVITAIHVLIGQRITAQMIDQALTNFPYALITGSEVSLDSVNYSNEVAIFANRYAQFTTVNIAVYVQP